MKPCLRFATWFLAVSVAVGCSGTETGNPATRGTCAGVVCAPCAPPIVLRISDALSGEAVGDATVDGDPSVCSVEALVTLCQLSGARYASPGVHLLELSASGHETLSVTVAVEASTPSLCCNCGYTPASSDVKLEPSPGSH